MLSTKADVDRHVTKTLAKLKSTREKNFRSYSIARLYFDVGAYDSCVHYVLQYLSVKDNNAAAHNLLGQAYKKLGQKEEALAAFKTSLGLDSNQNNLILKVCELLTGEDVNADVGCIRFWLDKAGAAFPRHPTVFQLSQRLLQMNHADSSAVVNLLQEQIASCPLNPSSHARLLLQLVKCNKYADAFNRAMDPQLFNSSDFRTSLVWQDAVLDVINAYQLEVLKSNDTSVIWNYWFLRLTTIDRKTFLQLGWKYSPSEVTETLQYFDQTLYQMAHCHKLKSSTDLIKHFTGQFCLYAGCLLLKKALYDQCGWRELTRLAMPLLLTAQQTDSKASDKNLTEAWTVLSDYRKSVAGHTILGCVKNKKPNFLSAIKQEFTEQQWRQKIFKELFDNKEPTQRTNSSFILDPELFTEPKFKLPNVHDLQEISLEAQKCFPELLHHQVWIGMNLEKISKVSCYDASELAVCVDNLPNCGPETLSVLDMDAFLYCCIIIAQQNSKLSKKKGVYNSEQPFILPSIIIEPLCSAEQSKWWEYAKRVHQRETGSQTLEIRQTLTRGIETIRCTANHGLDPYVLTMLGRIFSQRMEEDVEQKNLFSKRAALYYSAALPLLDRLKDHISMHPPKKRLFNFTHQELNDELINNLLEETKLFLGGHYMDENDDDRAIEMLKNVKSPFASYKLSKIYLKLADEAVNMKKENITSEIRIKRISLLTKSRHFMYVTSDRLKDSNADQNHPLSDVLSEHIENVESLLSSVDFDNNTKNADDYPYDDVSVEDFGNAIESTPERSRIHHNLNTSRSLEAQVRELQKREVQNGTNARQIAEVMDSNRMMKDQLHQVKYAVDELKTLILDSGDKRRFLTSIDDVRCKIEENRDENSTWSSDIKNELSALRRDVDKIMKILSQREDAYLMEENYRLNNGSMPYVPRTPNANPSINPHAYPHLYQPSNLYPMYSGQYANLSQLFQSQLFANDPSIYRDLFLPSSQMVAAAQLQTPQVVPPQVVPPQIIPPQVTPLVTNTQPAPITIPVVTTQASFDVSQKFPTPHDYQIPMPTQTQTVPSVLSQSTPMKQTFNLFGGSDETKQFSFFDKLNTPGMPEDAAISRPHPANKSRTLSEKSNDSYDPIPDFRPVISLPDEVTPVTGEEDEVPMFSSRAKLFRFVNGEWKERGTGQLKISKNTSSGKIRLLMRRDVVHTICANHVLTPEIEISLMKGTDKAYFWVANDFADDTVKLEKLCVRFKTVEIGKEFFDAFTKAIKENTNLETSNLKTVKEDKKADKSAEPKQDESAPALMGGLTFTKSPTFKTVSETTPAVTTAAEIVKPNPFNNFTFAKASNTATEIKFELKPTTTVAPIVSAPNTTSVITTNTSSAVSSTTPGWGDLFKPKPGSWCCNACYTNNSANETYCIACEAPKDPGMPAKEKKADVNLPKFSFGMPASTADTAPTTGFNFGISKQDQPQSIFGSFLNNSALEKKEEFKLNESSDKTPTFIIGSGQNEKYEFVFKPKTTPSKSPAKTGDDSVNDNEYAHEDEGHHIVFEPIIPMPDIVDVKTGEEDEVVIYSHRAKTYRFADSEWKECGVGDVKILQHKENKKIRVVMRREPIMKLCLNHMFTPDIEYLEKDEKSWLFLACDYSTGEICAQQFCIRFANKDVATQFKNATDKAKKLIEEDKLYEPSDEDDANKTGANLNNSSNLQNKSITSPFGKTYTNLFKTDDDVVFVSETEVTEDEIAQARKLKLPDKFYAYKQLPPCSGCRGCDKEEEDNVTFKIKNNLASETKPFNFVIEKNNLLAANQNNQTNLSKSGMFDFSNFNLGKTTASSIFGGATANTNPVFTTPSKPIFEIASTPSTTSGFIFGGSTKPIFSDSKCTLFDNKSIFSTTAATPTTTTTPGSIFGGFLQSNMFAPANDNKEQPNDAFKFGLLKNTIGTTEKDKNVDHNDSNEFNPEEENKNIFFKPIIPMPDVVEVKTGEEDEDMLYSHRAKLLRFSDSEWKECGVGDVKILMHKTTKKLRILMRREPIEKLCLNHTLTDEIKYIRKDPKSWLFSVVNFSAEKFTPENFCIRFVNADVAESFKSAIDKALSSVKSNISVAVNDSAKTDETEAATGTDENSDESRQSFRGLASAKLTVAQPDSSNIVKLENEKNAMNKPENNVAIFSGLNSFNFGMSKPINLSKDSNLDDKNTKTDITKNVTFSMNSTPKPINISEKQPVFGESFLNMPTVPEAKDGEINYFSIALNSLGNKEEKNNSVEEKPFVWEGMGTPIFQQQSPKTNNDSAVSDDYDPHYNPIVPLPKMIEVVTGEEDEEIVFQKRSKLFRWSDSEWKERGIGQMKILYHPANKSHRLLMRQEVVHKVVLNTLITRELDLLSVNNCPKSFMWMCINYTDDESGAMEKLAIRFGNEETAKSFYGEIEKIKKDLPENDQDTSNQTEDISDADGE